MRKHIRFGNYAMFTPETTKEDAVEALKKMAVLQLMDKGWLKIHFNDSPEPIPTPLGDVWGDMKPGGWTLEVPVEDDDHE